MKKSIICNPLILALFSILCFAGCEKEKYHYEEGMVWNTLYHVTYKSEGTMEDSIIKVMERVGKSLNVFDTTSIVGRLNRNEKMIVDNDFITVYDASRKINELSGGMFDPTVSPLVTAWGFGIGHKATADTLVIDSILTFIGINKTRREDNLVIKEDIRTQFNFSAIAKGYGCDAIGQMFKNNHIEDYMVEIGGEISLSGKSPSGGKWKISIDAPVADNESSRESALIIELTDKGIATSGNYRNYRKDGNQLIAHTISPLTGRPFISKVLSATVVAETCMEADGLATACMASDPEDAKNLFKESGTEGLLIFEDSMWMTPGFKSLIVSEEFSEPGRRGRN